MRNNLQMKILIDLNVSLFKIYQFIKLNHKCAGKVKVSRGEYIVDGKSILGVLSLDLTEKATIELNRREGIEYTGKLNELGFSYSVIE